MTARQLIARYVDHRDARRYDRLAGRAVDAIHAMADLEARWQNRPAVDALELYATRLADLADDVAEEIRHGRPAGQWASTAVTSHE